MKPQKPPGAGAIPALLQQAVGHHQRGALAEAERLYRDILAGSPTHFDALHLLGIVQIQKSTPAAAVDLIRKALDAHPANPNRAAALSNLGIALEALGRPEESLAAFDQALALGPGNPDALYNRGNALMKVSRYDEALADYARSLARRPGHPQTLNNRGHAQLALQRPAEALASFDAALAVAGGFAEAHNNRGTALLALQRPQDALASCERALSLRPDFAEALNNRGNALLALKRYGDAGDCFARLVSLAPRYDYALGNLLDARLRDCDWRDLASVIERVAAGVEAGERVVLPFIFLSAAPSPAAELACARAFVAQKFPAVVPSPVATRAHDRIRIAYLASAFHDHALAHLAAGVFEAHDRERFETLAISFGPDTGDPMRARLRAAFDHFVDVRATSDGDVARMLREREVDIAVDLNGFSTGSRLGIFAHRAAPVQVNFLGYPGTLGADYIDYIVADGIVIPAGDEASYAEKVVRLPSSYQANDAKRIIADWVPSRSELGLPKTGFVYCCFNANYKITPAVFDVWMRLLAAVPGSVLWLLEGPASAVGNLRREAQRRGVAADRLVFAPPLPVDRHLARNRVADLFLDTLPVNAHTTASDALWAGLPVLTCIGNTFAARVAASLLTAVGLPELSVRDLGAYEALALDLAQAPERLGALRARLAANRSSCALFDTLRFTRNLEAAYVRMWGRAQRGETPQAFDVAGADDGP